MTYQALPDFPSPAQIGSTEHQTQDIHTLSGNPFSSTIALRDQTENISGETSPQEQVQPNVPSSYDNDDLRRIREAQSTRNSLIAQNLRGELENIHVPWSAGPPLRSEWDSLNQILEARSQQSVSSATSRRAENQRIESQRTDAMSLQSTTLEMERECPVCLLSFTKGTLTECGHFFCDECISHWLEQKRHCPLCRIRLSRRRIRSGVGVGVSGVLDERSLYFRYTSRLWGDEGDLASSETDTTETWGTTWDDSSRRMVTGQLGSDSHGNMADRRIPADVGAGDEVEMKALPWEDWLGRDA